MVDTLRGLNFFFFVWLIGWFFFFFPFDVCLLLYHLWAFYLPEKYNFILKEINLRNVIHTTIKYTAHYIGTSQ